MQRMMTAETFDKLTKAGLFQGSDTIDEIQSWLKDYHKVGDPPTNPGDRNLLLSILDEIEEASQRWLTKHQNDQSPKTLKRIDTVRAINKQAQRDRTRITDLDLSKVTKVSTDETDSQSQKDKDKLKKKMEGDVSSCLTRAGFILDGAVPTPGDAASLEIDLEAPISHGAFIGFNLKIEGERGADNKTVKSGMTFLCTGGGSVAAAKLKGKLGGYIEAQGKDSQNVMELISYGFFRRMRESQLVPREIVRYMWGGDTSTKGHKLAERWAAGIELAMLESEEDLYVETGGVAGIEGEVGVEGVAKFGGEGTFKSGRKTDKQSLTNLKLNKYRQQQGLSAIDPTTMLRDPQKRKELRNALIAPPPSYRGQTQKKSGEGTRTWAATLKAETRIIGGEVSYQRAYSSKNRAKIKPGSSLLKYTLDSWELSFGAKVTLPLGVFGKGGARFAQMLIEWLAQVRASANKLTAASQQKALTESQEMGIAVELGASPATYIGSMAADIDPTKFQLTGVPDDPTELGGKSEIALQISGAYNSQDGGSLSVSMITTKGVESPIFKALIEKKKLLYVKKWPLPSSTP